jgi:hypothetical protein
LEQANLPLPDATKAFAPAFYDGQRGIVVMRTFNEAPGVLHPVTHVPASGY